MLTHIDLLIPKGKRDVSNIYHYTKVRDIVEKVSDKMQGLPRGQIFPVLNYEQEVDRSKYTIDMDVLLLTALRQILLSAETQLQQLIKRKGNNPVESS